MIKNIIPPLDPEKFDSVVNGLDLLRKRVRVEIRSNGESPRGNGTVKVTAKLSPYNFLERSKNAPNDATLDEIGNVAEVLITSMFADITDAYNLYKEIVKTA